MKRNCIVFNLIRELVLFAIVFVMVVGIFGVPEDFAPHFFRDMILSKAIGIGAGWLWWKLYQYWGERHLIYSWEESNESDNIA